MARKGENITKRKDGRWEARIIKGRTLDGKARYQYIYGKSYSEVRQKKKIISAHKHNVLILFIRAWLDRLFLIKFQPIV